MGGYVRTWRSLIDWEWYKDCNTKCLFLHLILMANHAEGRSRGVVINPGQHLTSSDKLAEQLGLSRQNIRTSLTKLKSTNEITIKSTNKYILVTIVNWAFYQSDEPLSTSKLTTEPTSNQPATNQQLTTNKKDKKEKKEKNINTSESISTVICSYTDDIGLQEALYGWNEMRTLKKKPLTPRAMQTALTKLDKLYGDKTYNVDYATMKCWESFYQPPDEKPQIDTKPKEQSKYQTVNYESRSD